MAGAQVLPPFPVFTDVDGNPLEDGFIFIGIENLDPVSSPVSVFWDRALTIPATQPIRTLGGYPSNAGVRARFYSSAAVYSILVRNKNGTSVYTSPSSLSSTDLESRLKDSTDVTKGFGMIGTMQFGLSIPNGSDPPAKGFWIDVAPGANIWRARDRILIGAAAVNDGRLTNVTKDWMETERASTTNNSQVATLSTIGQTAGLFASRSSDINIPGGMGCIGAQLWAINDNTIAVQSVYAMYGEARRKSGAGTTHGFEFDIVNQGSVVDIQPYQPFIPGLTVNGWLASGGEIAAASATAALAIINNGATFRKGIIFHALALDGCNGVTGSAVAVQMAKGHIIEQLFTGGSHGSSLSFDVSNTGAGQNMIFSDVGLVYRNNLNFNLLHVSINQSAVNGLNIVPGATNTGVTLKAEGGDTNIDLMLEPTGTGVVDFRNPQVTGGAGTQFGYITCKVNGTLRKIPIYNV